MKIYSDLCLIFWKLKMLMNRGFKRRCFQYDHASPDFLIKNTFMHLLFGCVSFWICRNKFSFHDLHPWRVYSSQYGIHPNNWEIPLFEYTQNFNSTPLVCDGGDTYKSLLAATVPKTTVSVLTERPGQCCVFACIQSQSLLDVTRKLNTVMQWFLKRSLSCSLPLALHFTLDNTVYISLPFLWKNSKKSAVGFSL